MIRLATLAIALGLAVPAAAQYARDPKQPVDAAYAAKMKEYTTAPYFTSPLVDYLPASKAVPTPKAVLVFNAILNHDSLNAGRVLDKQ
ncbi:MAG: hypothetical protein ACRD1S_13685 [Vicinamibacterales bacterium]